MPYIMRLRTVIFHIEPFEVVWTRVSAAACRSFEDSSLGNAAMHYYFL
jgi:hypothetical protein